jgi:hypothetical protein
MGMQLSLGEYKLRKWQKPNYLVCSLLLLLWSSHITNIFKLHAWSEG